MKRTFLIAALAAIAIAAILCLAGISGGVALATRWLGLVLLFAYGCIRRSLTTWIVVAMLIGAEIGHDFPTVATNLRVLSLIFLQLIKTIIAPLLFATLVSGIAGHADLTRTYLSSSVTPPPPTGDTK